MMMVMSKWIFENMPVITCPETAAIPERHPTPLGTTTVPRPLHTSVLGVPGERIAANARLGERGSWGGALPGTDPPRSRVVVMMMMVFKWIRFFQNMPVIKYPPKSCVSRAQPDPPRHHDRATPAPYISPRCPRRNNCRRCPLLGTDGSFPGNGADPRGRRG